MTTINVTATDAGHDIQRWTVPPDAIINNSPIPRGFRIYEATVAVPALGANDETVVTLTYTFPIAYCYLLKSFTYAFLSDDQTEEFDPVGTMRYIEGTGGSNQNFEFEIVSTGAFSRGSSAAACRNYGPRSGDAWRIFVQGDRLDTIIMEIADTSNDTSTAGDVFWKAEFWEYDLEQCLNYPVFLFNQLITP